MSGWTVQAERKSREAKQILDSAQAEGRALTASERDYVQELVDAAQGSLDTARRYKQLNGGSELRHSAGGGSFGSPGDLFVKSEGWRQVSDPLNRPQRWSTGPVEIASSPASLRAKAGTLLEGSGGQGAGFVSVPQLVPGVVERLFQPLSVADLLPSNRATTSSIRYMIEGTANSGAAGVLEAAVKPASDLAVSTVDEPVKKIATVLTLSDEILDDSAMVRGYVDGRLSLFVRAEEDRQLLRGTGGPELLGLFGRSPNVYNRGTVDDNSVAILKAMTGTRGSANLDVDGIVMHPDNYLSTRLLRDSAGQFLGGGPFLGAYGNASQAGVYQNALWGVPVALSTHVGPGTALIGSFGLAAATFRRGGVSLEISNSHDDYFVRNLSMARAEERLALCCYRPGAFTEIRGLS
jgi:HK97 family phage major capsid protein